MHFTIKLYITLVLFQVFFFVLIESISIYSLRSIINAHLICQEVKLFVSLTRNIENCINICLSKFVCPNKFVMKVYSTFNLMVLTILHHKCWYIYIYLRDILFMMVDLGNLYANLEGSFRQWII